MRAEVKETEAVRAKAKETGALRAEAREVKIKTKPLQNLQLPLLSPVAINNSKTSKTTNKSENSMPVIVSLKQVRSEVEAVIAKGKEADEAIAMAKRSFYEHRKLKDLFMRLR